LIITLLSAAYHLRMVRFQSIEESLRKIKDLASVLDKKAVYGAIIGICAVSSSYLAGSVSYFHANTQPVVLESCSMIFQATSTPPAPIKDVSVSKGAYVGSKSSKKFHHESCPSARLIKEGNRVYFSSREVALAAGYVPAGNCDR
jgi:hypothetical protein